MFHHFGGQSRVLFGFFISSRALLLQNASFLSHLYLKHPALTSGRNVARSALLFSNLLKHFEFFDIFQKFSFSNLEHDFSVIWIFRNRKSISFDIEKLTFMFSIDFRILKICHFSSNKSPEKDIFAKVPLSSGKQIII